MPTSRALRADALQIWKAALKAADAQEAVRRYLSINKQNSILHCGDRWWPLAEFDRIFVIGAGKAAAPMAVAVEQIIGAAKIDDGLINVKYGHTLPKPQRIRMNECGHPVPDAAGARGTRQMEEILRQLNARDLVFVLISGGASALLPAPARGITLRDKQRTTTLLLRAGADIYELNCVRKHLSAMKGGQLAELAYPATVVALLLSDVIGDPLDVICSGPTAPDRSTFREALAILDKFELRARVPRTVRLRLEAGQNGTIRETPKPGDRVFDSVCNVIIGSNRLALEAAAAEARRLGYNTSILSSSIQGETREVARVHAEILRESALHGHPVPPPSCILSGGETTVTVRGSGKGGRNQKFALAAALSIDGLNDVLILSAGTDGTDGPTDAAGAWSDGQTVEKGRVKRLSASGHLANNDSYPFFSSLGALFKTGATGTNVMDLNIMLAGAPDQRRETVRKKSKK